MKFLEIAANNLSKRAWFWCYAARIDTTGRIIFVADAYGDDGKRYLAQADEQLTALPQRARWKLGVTNYAR